MSAELKLKFLAALVAWLGLTAPGVGPRTLSAAEAGEATASLVWRFSPGGAVTSAPAVDSEGNFYLAAADGRLFSLSPEGLVRWSFQASESLFAGPTVDNSGRVHIADLDGRYYCLDADGQLLWEHSLSDSGDRRVLSRPVVDATGRSFVASWAGFLAALEEDGQLLWTHPVGGLPSIPPAVDDQGFLYFASFDRREPWVIRMEKLTPEGGLVWQKPVPIWIDRNRLTAEPLVDPGHRRIYLTAATETEGLLLGFDLESGYLLFSTSLPKAVLGTPAVDAAGRIYVGCLDGRLYCLDPSSGNMVWSFPVRAPYVTGAVTQAPDGDLLFADSDGILYRVSPDGDLRWQYASGRVVFGSPLPVSETRVAFAAIDGLHVVEPNGMLYLPQLAVGEQGPLGIRSRVELVNLGEPTDVLIEFFLASGEPWAVQTDDGVTDTRRILELPKGGLAYLELEPPVGDLGVGYARISAVQSVKISGRLEYTWEGQSVSETWLPSRRALPFSMVFAEENGPARTGVAILNPSVHEAEVRLDLCSLDGRVVRTENRSLAGGAQEAWFPGELFSELPDGSQRILLLTSDRPLVATTLRLIFDPDQPFPASVPVVNAFPVAGVPPGGPLVEDPPALWAFPQLASGEAGAYHLGMELLLLNADSAVPSGLQFRRFDGTPMPVALGSMETGTDFELDLGARSALLVQTALPGAVGFSTVASPGLLYGLAVARGEEQGVTLYETGIPAVRGEQRFSIPVEFTPNQRNTGVALVNVGADSAEVQLRLYDTSFRLLAETSLAQNLGRPLGRGEQTARFLNELFASQWPVGFRTGLLTVHSNQPLGAVALSQLDVPGVDFPEDVYRLVVRPVIPGTPDP